MKIIEGVKGSKARVNDDKTVDYCLIEKLYHNKNMVSMHS